MVSLSDAIGDVPGARLVSVNENCTSESVDGQPPLSVHVIVSGGSDRAIAEALCKCVPWGIEMVGDTTVHLSEFGCVMSFSRPRHLSLVGDQREGGVG